MKINNTAGNNNIIHNQYGQKYKESEKDKGIKVENGSINAASLTIVEDDILNKKQKIVKDALEIVRNQFKADSEIDETLHSCRARSAESREKLKEAQKEINDLEEAKNQAKEKYGDNSEEYYRLAEEYDKMKEPWEEQGEEAKKDITVQAGTIRGVKQEILKHHGMNDAEKAKEMLLEVAAKETIGSLIEEAREKIEQEIKETVEKGEEQKQTKEEKEAKLKEIQAEQKKMAQKAEEEAEQSHTTISDYSKLNRLDKQKEIIEQAGRMAEEQNILLEELKGVAVNTVL